MADSYEELLNRTWDEIPTPQNLPVGGWLFTGTTVALVKPKEGSAFQALKVLFTYKAKEPITVAEDLLAELGDYDFTINDLTYTIYIENAADWDKVRKHLARHGIEMEGKILDANGKLSFAKAFRGAEIVAEVGERSYENDAGETIWQNTLKNFQTVTE